MPNNNLTSAKRAKNDEFYTQYSDIQKEIESYLDYDQNTFRGKVVYSNCDDPFESNFFRYFALNFKRLGLKQLITTSYKPSPIANSEIQLTLDIFEKGALVKTPKTIKGRPKVTANKFIINSVGDIDGDGAFTLQDIAEQLKANKHNEWAPLDGDGDFRSSECIELLKQSDIVVTNPPFSLFREYLSQLVEHDKLFLIIGNMNAITYKEIFPLIKTNKMWLGNKTSSQQMFLEAPKEYTRKVMINKPQGMWWKIIDGRPLIGIHTALWFTNLDHGRRHQPLNLMSMKDNLRYNKKMKNRVMYDHYDNYDAIEVPYTDAIPSDYTGVMGVPISFLDKYSPEQFEILGMCENEDIYKMKTKRYTGEECRKAYLNKFGKKGTYDLNASGVLILEGRYEKVFQRVLIRHRKQFNDH
jgi:hypothetical protein